ncbi:redox-regulated ATPase YchF [Oceanivirga miroungae]|uniref:Ribosome-binding ATPase YchF n=1 Tax=Oceanivirga miroungae TaxID=1130046 RepID=A0A6I8M7L3_9FUSO|nr:redox-regulated ATPase YchF [Oceanivirga miroungae]VWL85416.1 GTP-dependent nucleic acid-binding protein EngD [Oceanivirga miroungae]
MIGIGIVGLPNVGKSTLFNAITKSNNALSANYPFATIEPNIGTVSVPDKRMRELEKIINPKAVVEAVVKFVDIAGLVKGASKGEGLGNQFLTNIRNTEAICQVVRCFDNDDIIHVDGKVDPIRDIETINLELIFSDIETINRALQKQVKLVRANDKTAKALVEVLEKCKTHLESENLLNSLELDSDELELIKVYQFLTIKPMMYALNIAEDDLKDPESNKYVKLVREYIKDNKESDIVIFSAKVESELIDIDDEEMKMEFLKELGVSEPSLDRLISTGYRLLGLITFFTAGVKELRAWTIKNGTNAQNAASEIHTDISRGFIRAETVSYDKFIEDKGWQGAKANANVRLEGKEYIVKDGDVMYFRFNV